MKHSGQIIAIALLAITFAVSGCATVVNGRTQEVTFSSNPPGATVFVDGVNVGTTPAAANLTRDGSHMIRIEKPGYVAYETTTVTIESSWDAANGLLFYGMILGMIADQNTGGVYDIRPTDISAELLSAAGNPVASNAPASASPSHFAVSPDGNLSPVEPQS